MEEKFREFGNKFIQYPMLLKGELSMRTATKKSSSNWPATPISSDLKGIFLDIIHDGKFDQNKYAGLSQKEQELFDRAVNYAALSNVHVNRTKKASDRDRDELMRRYDVLKGEVIAGSDSREILKKMRNLLIEMRMKNYISSRQYNHLMSEIVICL